MKYYIVDDSLSVVKILNRIVEEQGLGEVTGISTDPEKALKEIILEEPDIVLIDYLMPQMDGISLVRQIREVKPKVNFIMISQVSDKEMVAEAYQVGVHFFINKPINLIEVISVLQHINEKVNLENALGGIREIIQVKNVSEKKRSADTNKKGSGSRVKEIKYLLGILGMLGESGTADILAICEERLQSHTTNVKEGIALYCGKKAEDPKMVKQRIRRAVKRGLTNIAAMGVEDYYNEIFQNYHYVVFDFESIRAEMDYIRGKRKDGGKTNIDKFIEGLLVFSEVK
ncbi:DNA-binding domain-containing protein [Aminipila luticellarii]|uniref:Stage 0 sporulation protein A homolog n=1 Tax=Aminipila luticellarii TaxID=2507160 RepID=A0A410PW39_9FIRM|nr:DNA-binding domain-containing protein [Aminipila luticellarii]QAT43096.1 response regulator [Aminipila luticellarii]